MAFEFYLFAIILFYGLVISIMYPYLRRRFAAILVVSLEQVFGAPATRATSPAVQKITDAVFLQRVRNSKVLRGITNEHVYAHELQSRYGHLLHGLVEWQHTPVASGRVVDLHQGTGSLVLLPEFTATEELFVVMEHHSVTQGDSSYLRQAFGLSAVQETELEWNDFERVFRVMTSNPTVVRRLLTPDVMVLLHDWYQQHQSSLAIAAGPNGLCVFVENNLYAHKAYWYQPIDQTVAEFTASLTPITALLDRLTHEVARRSL